jgi:hypothetical protein
LTRVTLLNFKEKKEIAAFQFKQTILIELDKTQKNNITDMAWYEPRERLIDKIPLNRDLKFLCLFICFGKSKNSSYYYTGKQDAGPPKAFYSKGNHLQTLGKEILEKLPKKEVVVYALHQ